MSIDGKNIVPDLDQNNNLEHQNLMTKDKH